MPVKQPALPTPPDRKPRGRPRTEAGVLEAAHAVARDRICDAALALFDRGGIDAIVMREVAKEMGVSPMMPYKYFPSKDHILQELRTRAFKQLEQVLRTAAEQHAQAAASLEAILLAYLRFGREDPRAYRLMFDYWVYDNASILLEEFGESARRQSGAWKVLLNGVETYFKASRAAGDPLASAHLVWASLHGLVSLEASRKLVFGKAFDDLARPLAAAIMAGLPVEPMAAS